MHDLSGRSPGTLGAAGLASMAEAETVEAELLAPGPVTEPYPMEIYRDPDPVATLTLAIETSCDETSVAVLRGERDVLANVVSSQAALHERFGGVVPEIASREHVRTINPALAEGLRQADVTFWDLDVIAVTVGPGLIGSLVVGVAAAKALAALLEVPLVGVNHLEAHLYSNFLENPQAGPPALGLIVSGGHTLLVHMADHGIYDILGQTLDDAAGEAFDKVARFLGLGFPGGPAIQRLAEKGDREAIPLPRAMRDRGYDFSFSGLKTAVINHVTRERHAGREPELEDLCASFQEAVVDVQVIKTIRAARQYRTPMVLLAGGVAANSRLREALREACEAEGIRLFYPSVELCTDNAAMVAACGYHRYRRGIRTTLDVNPDPNLPLA
ncbi:MAG: tRNA (adenosine(37)-N6)-threonylcarbamoyltransferase complex transferase subunit TsaD [Actinomycetota bacterium]